MIENQVDNLHLNLIKDYLDRVFRIEIIDSDMQQEQYRVFSLLFEKITEEESIEFATLFSRIAFTAIKYNYPGRFNFLNHKYRRILENKDQDNLGPETIFALGQYLIYNNLKYVYQIDVPVEISLPEINTELSSDSKKGVFRRSVRGIALSINEDCTAIKFIPEEKAYLHCEAIITDDNLSAHLSRLKKYIQFPIHVNLIDSQLTDNVYTIRAIVLDPDFLIGVTSISECYEATGYTSLKYLSRKLIASEMSVHMLVGNIVNYYLDELINEPTVKFESLLSETFKMSPVFFAAMSDHDLKELISKVKTHFYNLQRVVTDDLAHSSIDKEQSYLEPSFFSNEYGIQGRLDLYHFVPEKSQSDIVELKSGKLFKTNSYGLNNNHYLQTLLYDLIIESVYKGKVKSNNYILYSALDKQNLRYAPKIRNQQLDAIRLRNEIIALEHILSHLHEDGYRKFLDFLDPKKLDESFHFLRRDAGVYYKALKELDELELTYYTHFVGFVSREYRLSKTGEHGVHRSNGLASLWLDSLKEKQESFRVLSFLLIYKNDSNSDDPCISLTYSDASNKLCRFRPGDIVIFYPHNEHGESALRNQVFKSTIIEISQTEVRIRLRARQKNFEVFENNKLWHLEGDVLDGGFNQQLHSLYHFIKATKQRRSLLLGLQAPTVPHEESQYNYIGLTNNQLAVIRAAIISPDYYLIWGPPGTGKTSIVIRSLLDYYYNYTELNVLLLAYTNRAVDEICNAITEPSDGKYIRIGSRYSTHPDYKKHLLSELSKDVNNRKELLQLFEKNRVFVSTVSSYVGKKEIKKLKNFDVVIIDEASQLLEPMIIGLLSSAKKFILIGDHKQLPAVVAQSDKKAYTSNSFMNEKLGINDLRISLFERLYKQSQKAGWNWSIGALMLQGRMHFDIVKYISEQFYEGQLKILPHVRRLSSPCAFKTETEKGKLLTDNRMLFVDTPVDYNISEKTNDKEAALVIDIILQWKQIYNENKKSLHNLSIGVITPFRAQIALIKKMLADYPDIENLITVDTIERYQGGARDIIVFSMAVNHANALDRMSNVSEEGIDRKLNVALTRAKEHIVILGSRNVLAHNKEYTKLIEFCNNVTFEAYNDSLNL
ncbi:AAA domain-containing protein [Saprospiraceae bacterium]|nr:AAA domain-containing protein [Saprospiraceae bacterium]